MTLDPRQARYERTERALAGPLLLAALMFIPVLIVPLAVDLGPSMARAFTIADVLLWLIFAAEYVLLLALAPSRSRFVRTHVLELVLVVVPFLRPLRILRSIRLLRLLRLTRIAAALGTALRLSRSRIAVSSILLAPSLALLLAAVAGIGAVSLERDQDGANITSLGDGIWWALTTMTTVGYGDRFPVTTGGRIVGGAVMLVGIALLGIVTASIAAAFVRWAEEPAQGRAEDGLSDLLAEVRALRAEVQELHAGQ